MKIEDMNKYYEQIMKLLSDVLIPIRSNKEVDKEKTDELYEILNKIKVEISGDEVISRKLAGLIVFIYRSVSIQSRYVDMDHPVYLVAAHMGEFVDEIIWENPMKKSRLESVWRLSDNK